MDQWESIEAHAAHHRTAMLEAARQQKAAMARQLSAFVDYAAMTADAELIRIMAQVRGA